MISQKINNQRKLSASTIPNIPMLNRMNSAKKRWFLFELMSSVVM